MNHQYVAVASTVAAARTAGKPVVALESTVIAHGLPWPENLETARAAEAAVRELGAIPATIAVLDGMVRLGLDDTDLVAIARSVAPGRETQVVGHSETHASPSRDSLSKANRRDLAVAISRKARAATTVSATLWIARKCGLEPRVMATGGLGGVHRDAAETFDISTDLDELAEAHGAVVVCSGFKSILDVAATLEVMETRGVLVVGYGTSELPGFLTHSSGLPLEHRVDTPAQAAALIRAHRALDLPGAIVLAQPVPAEQALDPNVFQPALENALKLANAQGITGKRLTPFLLGFIQQATAGQSLRANIALLVANARLAAEIAVALNETN